MKFKIMALVVAVGLVFSSYVFAAENEDQSQDNNPVEVGNKFCPVSGEDVKSMGGGVDYEYDGKIYTLCCAGCAGRFGKDPEKYSVIAEDDAAEESVEEEHTGIHSDD